MLKLRTPKLRRRGSYSLQKRGATVEDVYGSFRRLNMKDIHQENTLQEQYFPSLHILNDYEKTQVETFYSSLKTEVFVCDSTATLKLKDSGVDATWTHHSWGVPVLVLEKNVRPGVNRLWFYLAELGTGMPLWKDTITSQSGYLMATGLFQHLSVSWNHNITAGVQFNNYRAAFDFWLHAIVWLSSPENRGNNPPESFMSKLRRRLLKAFPKSRNSPEISVCDGSVRHITQVMEYDRLIYTSMQSLVGDVSEL